MNDTNNTEIEDKAVITIESVSDEDLETVEGGRSYGWGGGGWDTSGIGGSGFSDWSSMYY